MHSGIQCSWILIATVTGECEMGDISQNYHRTIVLMGYLASLPGPNAIEIPGKQCKLRAQKRRCLLQSAREEGGIVG